MTVLTQGIEAMEFLLSEADGMRARDQFTVTIAGAVALPSGTVLGKITATGKLIKYLDGAADGSQTAVGVLGTGCKLTLENPIVVRPGEFVAIIARNLGTVTTTGAITIVAAFDAYWE